MFVRSTSRLTFAGRPQAVLAAGVLASLLVTAGMGFWGCSALLHNRVAEPVVELEPDSQPAAPPPSEPHPRRPAGSEESHRPISPTRISVPTAPVWGAAPAVCVRPVEQPSSSPAVVIRVTPRVRPTNGPGNAPALTLTEPRSLASAVVRDASIQPVSAAPAGTEPSIVLAYKPAETGSEPEPAIRIGNYEAPASAPAPTAGDWLVQASCASCGGGGGTISGYGSMPSEGFPVGGCCGDGGCLAGKKQCFPCSYNSTIGRFLCGVYECICCPDPCYDPRWIPIADSAFFTEAPRPITQTRIRWDSGLHLILPDRALYFWGAPPLGPVFATTPYRAETSLNYNELSMYTEIATNLISFFFEMPYRQINGDILGHTAGFGDVNLGTKTLLYDCELFQCSMIMRTFILSGNFAKGLGTGHVSLEPSFLLGIRCAPDTYWQNQLAEWIPFGAIGAGPILRYNTSINQTLWRIMPNVPLIGTLEMQSWFFQGGYYTDPTLGAFQKASGAAYVNLGPGLRLFVCDRMDIGVNYSSALTEKHWAENLFRTEFRIRY